MIDKTFKNSTEFVEYQKSKLKMEGFYTDINSICGMLKEAYEQGRFDEANHIGACLRETRDKSERRSTDND